MDVCVEVFNGGGLYSLQHKAEVKLTTFGIVDEFGGFLFAIFKRQVTMY